jgi:hypothetical protein
LVHATGEPNCPLDEQVCTPLAEHCNAPGSQTPVQAPVTHAEPTHAVATPHRPVASHV